MKSNIVEWAEHYQEILIKYYFQLNNLLKIHKEPDLTYKEFVNFCYRNTKKTIIGKPGIFPKHFYATIGNNN